MNYYFKALKRNLNYSFNKLRLKKYKKNFLFLSQNLEEYSLKKKIFIYMNDDDIFHYGDRIFLFPLIIELNRFFNVIIVDNNNFIKIFANIYDIRVINKIPKKSDGIIVSYLTCFYLKKIYKKNFFIGIDLKSITNNNPIYPQILNSFNEIFKIDMKFNFKVFDNLINFYTKKYLVNNFIKNNVTTPYYIYSEDIDSQRIWKIFKNINKIRDLVILKSKKNKIIYTSIKKNSQISLNSLIDLSLKLSFEDLVYLIFHKNCLGVISFDNVITHLATISNKKIFFLSRYLFKYQSNKINGITIPFFKKSKNLINEIK